MIDGLCTDGKVDQAYATWGKLLKRNFEPDGAIDFAKWDRCARQRSC